VTGTPPIDPEVREFLEALSSALASDLVAEIRAGRIPAPKSRKRPPLTKEKGASQTTDDRDRQSRKRRPHGLYHTR
jgi:hypothetical protein